MVAYDAVMRTYVALGARAVEQIRRDGEMLRDQLRERKMEAWLEWDAARAEARQSQQRADAALDQYVAAWQAYEEAAGS